jgi:hypothetical protein
MQSATGIVGTCVRLSHYTSMNSRYLFLVVAALLIGAAVQYSLRAPARDDGIDDVSEIMDISDAPIAKFAAPIEAQSASRHEGDVSDALAFAMPDTKRSKTIAKLEAASESFRNTSFLLAIHEAGFVCEVVSQAQRVTEAGDSWRVECPRSIAFAVAVDDEGTLRITPIPDAFDAIVPFVSPIAPPRSRE